MSRAEYSLEHLADMPDESASGADAPVVALRLKGDWVAANLRGMSARLTEALRPHTQVSIDSQALESLDTAGALVLREALDEKLTGEAFPTDTRHAHLFEMVCAATPDIKLYRLEAAKRRRHLYDPIEALLAGIGKATMGFFREIMDQFVFAGQLMVLLALTLTRPSKLRLGALFNIMQRAGLESLPIVIITNFFIGAVIAFLGVIQLQQFGASIFAVDLTGMAVFRELAPMMAAILLAGRSASAFAAEIGSMKMNQEIDAMAVQGIDPYEALVLPRILALVIMMPLVTFMGMIGGLAGGSLAIWNFLDYDPIFFITRIWDYIPFQHFAVGMIKTPVFAVFIALIGCRAGLTVKEDVLSLGRQVTSAVVRAIFIIIMLDAMFALLFQALDL